MAFVLVAGTIFSAQAQLQLGINGKLAIPTGDLAEGSGLGYGGDLRVGYRITDNMTVGLSGGYILFGDESSEFIGPGSSYKTDFSSHVIPIIADFTYAFGELGGLQPYFRAAGGGYFLSRSFERNGDLGTGTGGGILTADGSVEELYLGVQPQVGIMFPISDALGVDINAAYNMIFGLDNGGDTEDNSGNAAYIGLNAGIYYVFGN